MPLSPTQRCTPQHNNLSITIAKVLCDVIYQRVPFFQANTFVLLGRFVNLTQKGVIREEGTSMEKIST